MLLIKKNQSTCLNEVLLQKAKLRNKTTDREHHLHSLFCMLS